MKKRYSLTVSFSTTNRELLYQGISWYNRNIIDALEITEDKIIIVFNRLKKADPKEYILSYSSPVRYQLYRAACFFLVVTGIIPTIEKIELSDGEQSTELDKSIVTPHWEHCQISITMPKETASKCFKENGKVNYTIITYFLKAQLDSFPHDAFRAAWSCLNGVYNQLSESQYEKEKLAALRELIRSHRLVEAESMAKSLSEDFWKRLQWYNYVQWKGISNVEEAIRINLYQDELLFRKLSGYLCDFLKKDNPAKAEELTALAERYLRKKTKKPNDRLRFIVTDYCYMIRNRSFHAGKPYPIFVAYSEKGNSMEEQLTSLILLTIKDILVQELI